jgi:hypothetical protein
MVAESEDADREEPGARRDHLRGWTWRDPHSLRVGPEAGRLTWELDRVQDNRGAAARDARHHPGQLERFRFVDRDSRSRKSRPVLHTPRARRGVGANEREHVSRHARHYPPRVVIHKVRRIRPESGLGEQPGAVAELNRVATGTDLLAVAGAYEQLARGAAQLAAAVEQADRVSGLLPDARLRRSA